jgi:DNA-binding NtrC family response regulator
VARALHALSERAGRPLVARNAATFPETLIDAELFGNAANYPNPGMKARPGLIGEADGSTLFLDEIGELPASLQAHLLRVLDSGEYHRLGESSTRRAEVRIVAATNRDPAALKHDLLARLVLRVAVPSLVDRREDVPMLAHHLLAQTIREDAEIGERFCDDDGRPRVAPGLVAALVEHGYTLHVRELASLLWRAIASSLGSVIELTEALEAELARGPAPEAIAPETLTPEEIEAALQRNEFVQERAWRDLGLKNRFVLIRLLRKHGIEPKA